MYSRIGNEVYENSMVQGKQTKKYFNVNISAITTVVINSWSNIVLIFGTFCLKMFSVNFLRI